MSRRLSENNQAEDLFDFVFKSKEEDECIKEKTEFDRQPRYTIRHYVIQKDPIYDPVRYAVYEEEIDMNNKDCVERLAIAWSHWIHRSSLNHYHGVRALAFRTLPVIPPAGQAALERYLEIESPSEQQKETARTSLREALSSAQKLQLAIVMEEINGCIVDQLGHSRMPLSCSTMMTIFLHCFVALKEVHEAGFVLDAFNLKDFVFDKKTNFVKLLNYHYTKQKNKTADKSVIFLKRNRAPEHGGHGQSAATIEADVYMLASCLQSFLSEWGYRFAESGEQFLALTGFLGRMLNSNPVERPTVDQILTEERFMRCFVGAPSQLAEIEHTGKDMYERAAEKYRLSKEVSTAETVAANLALCQTGQVKFTLVQETGAMSDMPKGRDDFVVPPRGVLPDVNDVQNSATDRSCFVVARNFCCPCLERG